MVFMEKNVSLSSIVFSTAYSGLQAQGRVN